MGSTFAVVFLLFFRVDFLILYRESIHPLLPCRDTAVHGAVPGSAVVGATHQVPRALAVMVAVALKRKYDTPLWTH